MISPRDHAIVWNITKYIDIYYIYIYIWIYIHIFGWAQYMRLIPQVFEFPYSLARAVLAKRFVQCSDTRQWASSKCQPGTWNLKVLVSDLLQKPHLLRLRFKPEPSSKCIILPCEKHGSIPKTESCGWLPLWCCYGWVPISSKESKSTFFPMNESNKLGSNDHHILVE